MIMHPRFFQAANLLLLVLVSPPYCHVLIKAQTNSTSVTSTFSLNAKSTTYPSIYPSDQPSIGPAADASIATNSDAPSSSPLDQHSSTPSSSPIDSLDVPIGANIINGNEADFGEYPFYAWPVGGNLCGGTLIHEDIILTAAHCTCEETFLGYDIFIGGIFLDGSGLGLDDIFKGSDCYFHEKYDTYFQNDDIMLVKLDRPSSAPLVTLNFDPAIPKTGDAVTSIGYGRTNAYDDQSASLILLEVDTFVESDAICDSLFTRRPINPNPAPLEINPDFDPETNVCTFTPDTCRGDSGGPLLTPNSVQIGITSYGLEFCGQDMPGYSVKTEVAAYENWIKQGICKLSSNCPEYCESCPYGETTPSPTPDPTYDPTPAPIYNTDDCDYGKGKGGKGGKMMKCKKGKKTPKEPKTPKAMKDKKKMGKKGKRLR